jgi:hypothetical protein
VAWLTLKWPLKMEVANFVGAIERHKPALALELSVKNL